MPVDVQDGFPGSASGQEPPGEAAKLVSKPWGNELIWARTERYVGKLIVVDAGRRLSLQKHLSKDESILVISGRLELSLEAEDGTIESIEMSSVTIAGSRSGGCIGSPRSSEPSWWRCPRWNSTT